MRLMHEAELRALLRAGVEARIFPSAHLIADVNKQTVSIVCGTGEYGSSACVPDDPIYDLASLTKVVGTVTAVMKLVEDDMLCLDDYAYRFLPRLAGGRGKKDIKIVHLLTHMAGFPGPTPLYRFCATAEQFADAACDVKLVSKPGSKRIYDDLSYWMLGRIVESVSTMAFEAFCNKYIFEPLEMRDTMFKPPRSLAHRIMPTEIDLSRGGLLRGLVHDENAYVLGCVSGHAGLFSTGRDLLRFSRMMLSPESGAILRPSTISRIKAITGMDEAGTYSLGWDNRVPRYMDGIDDEMVIGHTGFTGTSIVISQKYAAILILLSNRVCPSRDGPPIDPLRSEAVRVMLRQVTEG